LLGLEVCGWWLSPMPGIIFILVVTSTRRSLCCLNSHEVLLYEDKQSRRPES
jgi:hypothetical protein